MKQGDLILVDEISLADDSVLERLNSVLEPERKLLLAEQGGSAFEPITAHPNFFILATMNPGGDYGKKELSPALRNRFTEIWVPSVTDINDLRQIATERLIETGLSVFANCMLSFWEWFNKLETGRTLTIRDLLSWISFIEVMVKKRMEPEVALLHGLFLVLLDGISLGTSISKHDGKKLREDSLSFICRELKAIGSAAVDSQLAKLESYGWGNPLSSQDTLCCDDCTSAFGIEPFYISKGSHECMKEGFEFLAPTTRRNVLRVLRAMQLSKPVLLEGSPGVGKTSLIVALAKYSGHNVVRINLSEQTDMMDLLGSDLPVQGENGMEFSWSDGILLQAIKNKCWVLLDELNLAPQSVLEGLNAILDHRGEVFIPELGKTFKCRDESSRDEFRVFACQNPSSQGGGRKGLPKSFLNRFIKVYVDELDAVDYLFICQSLYPSISETLLSKLITFNRRLYEDTMVLRKYGQDGSPWEFNLRDIMRSCQIIQDAPNDAYLEGLVVSIYIQRMRTVSDRHEVLNLFQDVFGAKPLLTPFPKLFINPQYLIVGNASFERNHSQPSKLVKSNLQVLPGVLHMLEAALYCVQQRWLCILVGPYSSGKTSLVRLLAHLTGNVLHELNLSPGTDVTDLLGCFEQYNFFRNYTAVVRQVKRYVDEYFCLRVELDWKELIIQKKDLFAVWFEFFATESVNSSVLTDWKFDSRIIDIIQILKHDIETLHLPVSWSGNDLDKLLKIVFYLEKNMSTQPTANFEWVPGDLVKAIENGDWVVLENANLCNPTVLDRINSLVEQNGSITINECGLVDGETVVLHAHPKFRMFITVDPKHGEVSRAMRNRGVEIFMMQPSWIPGAETYEDHVMNDARRFLILAGIPSSELVLAMSKAHIYAQNAGLHRGVRITLLELTRWVQLFQQLLLRGNQPNWSLQLSWEHTYLSSLGEAEGMDVVMQAKSSFLSISNCHNFSSALSLLLPGGWPLPLMLQHLSWHSRGASVRQNCQYLEFLISQSISYQFNKSSHNVLSSCLTKKIQPAIAPFNLVNYLLFPNSFVHQEFEAKDKLEDSDINLVNEKLFLAANWTFEQATPSDFHLYVKWFELYKATVQPYCSSDYFFDTYIYILEQERKHPIWTCIEGFWNKVTCDNKINLDMHYLPKLCPKILDFPISYSVGESFIGNFENAIKCVKWLRLTYKLEEFARLREKLDQEIKELKPALDYLIFVEIEVFKLIFKHKEHKDLLVTCTELLEYHMLFLKFVTSSNYKYLPIIWNFLWKEVGILQHYFSELSHNSCVIVPQIISRRAWYFPIRKPFLWLYGGHPVLPSSDDVYYEMRRLLKLCDTFWPRLNCTNQDYTNAIVSTNIDLRRLAIEGVGLSLFMISNDKMKGKSVVSLIKDFHEGLLRRFEIERGKVVMLLNNSAAKLGSSAVESTASSSCCSLSFVDLCTQSGFESWLAVVPLFDVTCLSLDIKLLQKLSKCLLEDVSGVSKALSNMSQDLQHALEFSLNFSSRSPVDYLSHQMILWIADESSEDSSGHSNISSLVLDMWYKYHSSIWTLSCEQHRSNFANSCYSVQSTRTSIIESIMERDLSIKDYNVNGKIFRILMRNLWETTAPQEDRICLLHSAVDSLFKQIITVHRESFDDDVFIKIKSILWSLLEDDKTLKLALKEVKLEDMKYLVSSLRNTMPNSLVESHVEHFLTELYIKFPATHSPCNLGRAWLHLGMLRFGLLLEQSSYDPALEYAFRHLQIRQKISILELETRVNQECKHLAGSISKIFDVDDASVALERLTLEEEKIRAKMIFRPEHSRYQDLILTCKDFKTASLILLKSLDSPEDIYNWQVTSTSFINRLSEEYCEYADIVQPVQVAVYEMKLGLSLVSTVLESQQMMMCEDITESNLDSLQVVVHFLMQFFEGLPISSNPTCLNYAELKLPGNHVSLVHLENMVHYTTFTKTADKIFCSRVLDKGSFLILSGTFTHFTSRWVDEKLHLKEKEDEGQYYQFRPRVVKIEDILDEGTTKDFDTGGSLMLETDDAERKFAETKKLPREDENIEEHDLIPEAVLMSILRIRNQLFGSSSLVEQQGASHLAKEDRLLGFMQSYTLGSRLLKGLEPLRSLNSDKNFVLEHMLYVCLKLKETVGNSHQQIQPYRFHKDPNAAVLNKMVQPLSILREHVKLFLNEWTDHPGLQKLLDGIELLLAVPVSTPLSKALHGLQLIVSRAESLQETASIFSLSDQLHPLYSLMSSWQKLEFDSWPTFVDEVQKQYDDNAEKLWLPLQAVLYRNKCSSDVDTYSTIKSLEDFVQTSSVGEFKKRLDLLISFHSQLKYGINLEVDSSLMARENLKILYNAFGYYVQFLPIVLLYIETVRRSIESDLREHLKLLRWDQTKYYTMEVFNRKREKLRGFIQKFNDVLQEPVMVIINKEQTKRRENCPSWLEDSSCNEMNIDLLQFPLDLSKFSNAERFNTWKHNGVSELLHEGAGSVLSESTLEDFKKLWNEGWSSLERICRNAAELALVWKHGTKNLRKRRALSNLLKTLKESGLTRRHRPNKSEDPTSLQVNKLEGPTSLYLQPSYDMEHLVEQKWWHHSSNDGNNAALICHEKLMSGLDFSKSNKFYFENLAVMQQLREVCYDFSKDVSFEQVNQAVSFLDHLIFVQQRQRDVAYSVSKQLERLALEAYLLNGVSDSTILFVDQNDVLKCMGEQKQLLDDLLTLSRNTLLLLENVKDIHLKTCDNVMDKADMLYSIIHDFVPRFEASKKSLDICLIGSNRFVMATVSKLPCVATENILQLVTCNFQIIKDFDDAIKRFKSLKKFTGFEGTLLKNYQELIDKAIKLQENIHHYKENAALETSHAKLNSEYGKVYRTASEALMDVHANMSKLNGIRGLDQSLFSGNITVFQDSFHSFIMDILSNGVTAVSKLEKSCETGVSHKLKHLSNLFEHIISSARGALSEFLEAHTTTSEMTNVLMHIFILIFSKGFGSAQEAEDNGTGDKTCDASGTGMGEGEGINDVSEQIEDEAQLLGSSDKKDGLDKSDKLPSSKDKGIEMEEDFDADTFSVSEGSESENNSEDEEDPPLDSQMGKSVDDSQVADQKPWDMDDECSEGSTDKYETGEAVRENDASNRELRAKNDDALQMEESDQMDDDGTNELSEENNEAENEDGNDGGTNDMKLDKSQAFEDPTGIQFPEEQRETEDADMDEPQISDMEESDTDSAKAQEEINDGDDKSNEAGAMADANTIQEDENLNDDEPGDQADDAQMDLDPTKEGFEEPSDHLNDGTDSTKTADDFLGVNSTLESEIQHANSNNLNNTINPSETSSGDVPNLEISMPNSLDGSKVSHEPFDPKSETSSSKDSSIERTRANPYRSLADAMDNWKERAKVLDEPREHQSNVLDDIADVIADEYRYVLEAEKGNSQALGDATSDQINNNFDSNPSTKDENEIMNAKNTPETDMQENYEINHLKSNQTLVSEKKSDEALMDIAKDRDMPIEEQLLSKSDDMVGDIVSFQGSYMGGKIMPLHSLVDNKIESNAMEIERVYGEGLEKAVSEWKRCELATTRLSQALAEQLRLIMEPTLASKLQGDYKTGKRINIKKVIQYIASYFRKDKIWLRKTRPNKRNYQVVVAVDDSRSMSESHCENVAVEALVTVCRAMSQLEVGQFAVSSFGEKGNIKLLHDFDQPFTGEAGVNIISNLSFKQDNTIADEPVVDLLRYLNSMLDRAVTRARGPSGQNPLNQLILIIADGRFHEKENLKRRVRDVLNKKRMVAFIIVDSPQESILDLMEASFEDEQLSFKKYLNSFPFPYYIVLRNIEALPQTLADLLRQWFELMQNSGD